MVTGMFYLYLVVQMVLKLAPLKPSADVVLAPNFNVGVATIITVANDLASVIRSTNPFPGQIKAGNILSFTGNLSQTQHLYQL